MITTNDTVRTLVPNRGFPAGSVGKVVYTELEDDTTVYYVRFPETLSMHFGYSAADLADVRAPQVALPADCKSLPTMTKLDILADVTRRLGIELVAGEDEYIMIYDGPLGYRMVATGGSVDIFPTGREFTLEG